jgi:dermatan/chondrotin sulfate uronyl 2-O-sulfotransferase UST
LLHKAALCDEIAGKVRETARETSKTAYDRHLYFTDVNGCLEHNVDVTLISLVRDPIDKAVSRFYYNREIALERGQKGRQSLELNASEQLRSIISSDVDGFEDCVKKGLPECLFLEGQPYDLTIPYFCGHHPSCQ